MPEDIFRKISAEVPDSLWKPETPAARHAAAAEYWQKLTKMERADSVYDDPQVEYGEKESSATKVAASPAGVKATTTGVGALLGAAGTGTRQYFKSKERAGGKSQEEIERQNQLNHLLDTVKNEGKQGRISSLKQKYLEMQLAQAAKNKEKPLTAALKAAIPGAVAGGAVGYAGGRSYTG
jgi:uncharacterized protein HemX